MNEKYAFHLGEADKNRLQRLNDICNAESQTFILPYLKKGMNLLEVGAGHGHMLPWFLEQVGQAGSVTALDINEEQIDIIKSKLDNLKNLFLKVGSVYHLEKLNEFDCIYCRFLFMHLHDTDTAIKNMLSRLNKNGVLLIEEPTLSSNFCYPESYKYKDAVNLLLKLGITYHHDYDIGLKLVDKLKKQGAFIEKITFSQPVLFTSECKSILRLSLKAASKKFIHSNLIDEKELKLLLSSIENLETNDDYVFTLSRQTQIVAINS